MTDLKVVEFPIKATEANPRIIECLELMLAQAKEGKIKGLLCSALDHNNMANYIMSGELSFGSLGALHVLSTKLANSFIARAE